MEALINIQAELKAPKGQKNTFGNYSYRSCEDILEAVKPLLKTNECTLTISDTMEMLGDRFYVKATVTLTNKDSIVTATAYAREPREQKGMNEAQITGSASSYARKYALNGLFAIDDTKDADATNAHGKEQKVEKKEYTQSEVYIMTTADVEIWEGKIYGKSIYLNGEKKTISDEQIAKLKAHAKYIELPPKK